MDVGVLFEGGVDMLKEEWDKDVEDGLEVEVDDEALLEGALAAFDVALAFGAFADGVGVEAEEKAEDAGSDAATLVCV